MLRPAFVTAVVVILVPLLLAAQSPPQRRPMRFDDLMKMRRLGEIDLSPDGKWALFTVTDADLESNTRTPHLWVLPVKGGEEKPITSSQAGESRGKFSPDGKKVLFLSARGGVPQIYIASFDSSSGNLGSAEALTTLSTGAGGELWAPDGNSILFTSFVYPGCTGADEDACDKQRDEEQNNSKVKARIFTGLLFRHWDQFTGEKRKHLFLIPAAGGNARDLTPGTDQDIPPFSLGEPDGYAFSPDSKEISFEWKDVPEPAISTNTDIFKLSLTDSGAKPVRLSTGPGGDFTPRYSPDGKYVAYRSQLRAGYESDRFRLMLYNRQDEQTRELLPDFDRWVDDLAWAPDSQSIYFVTGVGGEDPAFEVDAKGKNLTELTGLGVYGDLHPTSDGEKLVLSRTTLRQPAEIYVLRTREQGKAEIKDSEAPVSRPRHGPSSIPGGRGLLRQDQLTHLNSALLAQLDLPGMENFWFTGAQHERVEGFLLQPPGFDPEKKYPVKFLIHGGPEGEWNNSWSYRWNAELFAASGYVVVMINPRGSVGYGQDFIDGVNGDWGGKPYIDLMRGLDHAEVRYPFIDKTRECALGASYGGYMADWILGHTNRFACIVTHDGMFDPEAFYGSTDELWFPEWEFKGTPWREFASGGGSKQSRSLYRRWSPMLFSANFKTPTLIIHSQLDYRLDVSQGFELFTTLERLKVPTEMLYFPDEGHWVLKPQNSRLWNETVSAWCDRYTKTHQSAAQP